MICLDVLKMNGGFYSLISDCKSVIYIIKVHFKKNAQNNIKNISIDSAHDVKKIFLTLYNQRNYLDLRDFFIDTILYV